MDSLRVQRDDVAGVVRLLDGDMAVTELDPAEAEALGEAMLRASRELQTTQATLAGEGQASLDEVSAEGSDDLMHLLEDREDPPELGEMLNPNDPLDW